MVAGVTDARRVFAQTIEDQSWSKDECEAALRTLKDPGVDDAYKRELLRGKKPPLADNEAGEPIVLPDTIARQAREDERKDATGALYELIAAASALDHRLNEAQFEHMSSDDIMRSLSRLDDLVSIIARAQGALRAGLRVESLG
jgi:hypothetical protein